MKVQSLKTWAPVGSSRRERPGVDVDCNQRPIPAVSGVAALSPGSLLMALGMKVWQQTVILLAVAALLVGCRRDMIDGARYKPLEPSGFFADGGASRPLPAYTLARGELRADEHYFTGRVKGQLVTAFPKPVTREMLERGRQRYDIYCAVCHGRTGDGQGMIVRRGFPPPPSLHLDRLREVPVGHFFEVITNGFGVMYPYASRVEPADRWAIAAYIRALQLSQHAALTDAEPGQRAKLEAMPR